MSKLADSGSIDKTLKIVFLGDSGVGKTTILGRYIHRNFEQFTQPTVGTMFFCKKLVKGDKTYELQIWDTAGQEKFRSITPIYFRDANGVILVCDVTNPSSFNSLRDWNKLLDDQGPKDLGKYDSLHRKNHHRQQNRYGRQHQGNCC
jgi:small GTP-binding protein